MELVTDTAMLEQGEDNRNTEKQPKNEISSKTKTTLTALMLWPRGKITVKTNPKGSGRKRTDMEPAIVEDQEYSASGKAKQNSRPDKASVDTTSKGKKW